MRRLFLLLTVILLAAPSLLWADDIAFYGPCWADASGSDGKGGVSLITVGKDHKFVMRADPCKGKTDLQSQTIFDSDDNQGNCLSFEFTWVTTSDNKFYGKMWAGSGLAFNNSWGTIDISTAKYLVFYAKTNAPGAEFNVSLSGAKDGVQSSPVKMSEFAEGHVVGTDWTKVVIPIASFPDLSKMDLTQAKTIRFDLLGTFPENKLNYIRLDKVVFSSAKMVTPVENLGWLRVTGGVALQWDKANDEGVDHYSINVDGKVVGQVKNPKGRKAMVPASYLPGKGTHVVSVASGSGRTLSSYQSVTVTAAPAAIAAASVSVSAVNGHPVSPYIFGFNYVGADTLKKAGGTLNRWGGNATTNYNWKDDADNRGADWYYLNTGGPVGIAEKDKRYYKFIQDSITGGASPIVTLPINGWVAKAPVPGGKELSSYPMAKWPNQTGNDGQGSGNGQLPGNKKIWDNDPNDNFLPSDPKFQAEWVQTIVQNFGTAAKGGVRFYQMDNEPGLWQENHRDVVPKGIGYDELADLNAKYAAAAKAVDPGAEVIGMVAWGAMELAGSAWDYMPGGEAGYKKEGTGDKWTDRKAHGDVPQVAWFLKEMNRRSKLAGKRLIDYVDDHGFPEVWGTNGKGEKVNVLGDFAYDPVLTPKQFDAMRIFYDPTFQSPDSWCANPDNKPYLWDPFVGLIPKLKKIIAENYPGTKLAMTEYYPSSKSYFHGGLLEAVNLGIFMREGMDLACDWGGTEGSNYVFWGHKLFSNFDDKGSKVGGDYVPSATSTGDLYSFAARDGQKTYVVLVNKNHETQLETSLALPAAATAFRTYTLAETSGKRLYDSGPKTAGGAAIKVDVPAFSAVLVVAQ